MDKKEDTLLNGQFRFKLLPDGTLDKSKVFCVLCKGEFNYHRSSSSLTYHLKAKHPGVAATLDGGGLRQTTLQQFAVRGGPLTRVATNKITEAIACWVAKNCRPVNIVEDAGLRDVIREASGDSAYHLPARSTVMSRIETLYNNQKAIKQRLLEQAPYIALTCDHWTSASNANYLGATAHFIDDNWCLHSFALTVSKSTERHYAEACAQHIQAVTQEWNIEKKITTLGTDSARNLTAAARLLPYEHLPCTAHSLQRAITVSLADSGFDAVLTKCRKIVGHFKHSPANARELNQQQVAHKQKEESLIQDVPTRWNSTLHMITRIQQNKSPIEATLSQQNSKIPLLTEAELGKLKKLEELLEPCRYVTETLGGQHYISCSVVLPAFCHLFRVMEPSDDDTVNIVRFKKAFCEDLAKRKENSNLTWLKNATALDPRFKDLKCLPKSERGEVWSSLNNLLKEDRNAQIQGAQTTGEAPQKKRKMSIFLLASSDSDTDDEAESIQSTLDRYKSESKTDMDECPLQWWSKRRDSYPRLEQIARKYLSTPATTVPCERLFSLSGHIIQKKRATLSSSNVERLVCLSSWLNAQQPDKEGCFCSGDDCGTFGDDGAKNYSS
uniref:Zinc finger BED domain-containing protein 1-like n=1 Tax=Kryptolebias marmoratus TaxID=37003 RepID=A0A3Q3AW85_KRYMA